LSELVRVAEGAGPAAELIFGDLVSGDARGWAAREEDREIVAGWAVPLLVGRECHPR
jgi:hypothetical protein